MTNEERQKKIEAWNMFKKENPKVTLNEWYNFLGKTKKKKDKKEDKLRLELKKDYLDNPQQSISDLAEYYGFREGQVRYILKDVRKHKSCSLKNIIDKNKQQVKKFFDSLDKEHLSDLEKSEQVELFLEENELTFHGWVYSSAHVYSILKEEGII